MKQAIGYVRISTEEQSFWSLDGQENQIKDYCNKNNLELVRIFRDDGQSGGSFNRREWKKLEDFLRYNKVSVLLVLKYERFSRNLTEALVKIQEFETKHKIKVVSIMEDIGIHHDSPMFFSTRTQLLLNAHMERLNIKERTIIGLRTGAQAGRHMGRAPFGYINERDDKNRGIITQVPEEAEMVRYIFDAVIQKKRYKDILKTVNEEGFRLTGKMAIQRIIKNPIYKGKVKVNGHHAAASELAEGIHDPIVSPQKFRAANSLIKSEGRRIQYNNEVYLRGVLYCQECGSRLTSTRAKKTYYYYECKSDFHRLHFNAVDAHKKMDSIISRLSFSNQQLDYLRSTLNKKSKSVISESQSIFKSGQKKIDEVAIKIDKVQEKFILSEIDNATYQKFLNRFSLEKEILEDEINASRRLIDEYDQILGQELLILKNIEYLFQELSVINKQRFLNEVFGWEISYSKDGYQTNYLNPVFAHNYMALNKLDSLTFVNESKIFGRTPLGDANGAKSELNRLKTIRLFFNLLNKSA